jgi:hypothetical protein
VIINGEYYTAVEAIGYEAYMFAGTITPVLVLLGYVGMIALVVVSYSRKIK